VRGTREKKFQDGIFSMSTRDASALIRTSVMSIANAARHETLQANDDVIDGQQWLSTLDPRTCVACMALSGQAWDSDGNPLGDTTADFPGPPPLHWACRCTLSALLKSWEQLAQDAKGDEKLGRKLDRIEKKIGKGTQASMGGPVPADFSYSDWLERRSEPEQQEILGQGKWQLWKDGKIGLTDLIDQSARPLTMKELSKRA
jgi:SPP1 gp7 family putative phage head morphogenesis protein